MFSLYLSHTQTHTAAKGVSMLSLAWTINIFVRENSLWCQGTENTATPSEPVPDRVRRFPNLHTPSLQWRAEPEGLSEEKAWGGKKKM